MNEPTSDRLEQILTRVTSLEEAVSYCERTVDDLDQVMRDFQKRIGALEGRLTRLSKQLGFVADSMNEGPERKVEE
ncbi:MAG: SlyX family protein [Thermoguttaceae bacterium]|jgi:uncharacterized coiled-coil protein SlyX